LAGGLNLYGFAGGDPINFSDPFGLYPCPPDCGPIHTVSVGLGGTVGAVLGATGGAATGSAVLPIAGTIGGGVAGGVAGAIEGAAYGLAVANVAVGTAELIGGYVQEFRLPKPIRTIINVGAGILGSLFGDPSPPPPPGEGQEIRVEQSPETPPPGPDPKDPDPEP
jgi:hypothetical protein